MPNYNFKSGITVKIEAPSLEDAIKSFEEDFEGRNFTLVSNSYQAN